MLFVNLISMIIRHESIVSQKDSVNCCVFQSKNSRHSNTFSKNNLFETINVFVIVFCLKTECRSVRTINISELLSAHFRAIDEPCRQKVNSSQNPALPQLFFSQLWQWENFHFSGITSFMHNCPQNVFFAIINGKRRGNQRLAQTPENQYLNKSILIARLYSLKRAKTRIARWHAHQKEKANRSIDSGSFCAPT